MSQAPVMFEGREMSLEQAVDKGVMDLQSFLNGLQCQLRTLAAMDDLSEDPAEDFKEMIGYTDKADDAIDDMEMLFAELKDVTRQILGPCPKVLSQWYKDHKRIRKEQAAAAWAGARRKRWPLVSSMPGSPRCRNEAKK